MGTSGPTVPYYHSIAAYFHRHPILFLLVLTPGIPEYLSGSSSVALIVVNPVVFFLFLGLNLGLYGPGVLLVREAHVRWKRGWSTILLLGAAYGLLEEGTALSTLFNPNASVVGGLGTYGHAYGVSWVWLIGILGVHIVLSVGVPILLLGLALPETRGQPFLTGRALPIALTIYFVDIVLLELIIHYWVGIPLQLLVAGVAVLLWVVAWRLPPGLLDPPTPTPTRGPRLFFVYGLAYFVLLVIVPGLIGDFHLPAYVAFTADGVALALLFFAVRQEIGRGSNAPQMVILAFGVVVPIMTLGFFAQVFLPIVLVFDVLAVLFFLALWRHYRPTPAHAGILPPAAVT